MKQFRKLEGATKLKTYIIPMLAELTDQPAFDDPNWIFEIKWDGYRAIAEVRGKERLLYSRNGLSFAKAYPQVFDALSKIRKDVILDGELVVLDPDGKPSFQKLQNYSRTQAEKMRYYVFDCLSIDGEDLTHLPLLDRKNILRKILPKNDIILYCDHVAGEGVEFFNQIRKMGLEGMIAKRGDSHYYKGKRTSLWLKIKNIQTDEAIIIGYTPPKGQRPGFGSLLLAQRHRGKLNYIGNVGTGFTDNTLRELYSRFQKLRTTDSPLAQVPKTPAGTTWLKPVLVCNIKFTEKTSDGILRHPVFQGLRVDKAASEVTKNNDVRKKRRSKS